MQQFKKYTKKSKERLITTASNNNGKIKTNYKTKIERKTYFKWKAREIIYMS